MDQHRAPAPGAMAHAMGWLAAALRYLRARAELAKIEAKEAGARYGIAAGLIAGALVLALFGYLLLMLAVIFGVAALFDSRHAWIVVMGITALLHFGGALVLVLSARKRVRGEPFPTTIEELKKDESWLTQHANKRS